MYRKNLLNDKKKFGWYENIIYKKIYFLVYPNILNVHIKSSEEDLNKLKVDITIHIQNQKKFINISNKNIMINSIKNCILNDTLLYPLVEVSDFDVEYKNYVFNIDNYLMAN